MKNITFSFVLAFVFTAFPALGQHKTPFRGLVLGPDSAALTEVPVSLLRVTDSTIVAGVLTDGGGRYSFAKQDTGSYLLYITAAGHQPLCIPFHVHARSKADTFYLKRQTQAGETVTVTGLTPPVLIKADTVEYNPAAFKTRPNDAVEDLLKKMPGFKLEPDGTLSYNGEKITRVLVDGKPFQLENAATLKTLPIHVIEKIQLIDEKSKDQKYSKVDDGKREKVLNLTVKKNKKKGWLGNISASAATNRQRQESLGITRFNNKRKMHLSLADAQTVQVQGGQDNRGNNQNGQFSFNNAWGEGMSVSARGSGAENRGNSTRSALRQTFLKNDTVLIGRTRSASSSSGQQQAVFVDIDREDSGRRDFSLDGGINFNNGRSQSAGSSVNSNNFLQPVNTSSTSGNHFSKSVSANGSLSWNQRLDTNGRSISARVSVSNSHNDQNGYNRAENFFYNPDSTVKRQDQLNQYRQNRGRNMNVQAGVHYNMPVFKNVHLQASYSFSYGNNRSERLTYDFDALSGKYSLLNKPQTNGFSNRSFNHRQNLSLGYYKNGFSASLRAGLQQVRHINQNSDSAAPFRQSFFNIMPGATFSMHKRNRHNIRFNYNGHTSQPSIWQRQPVVDNSNPLFIRSGNPALRPEFTNQFNLQYSKGNRINGKNFSASADFSNTINRITDVVQLDGEGKQFSRPDNINGNYRGNLSIRLSYPISLERKSYGGISFSAGNSRTINFVNGLRNTGLSTSLGGGLSASQNFGDWLFLNGSFSYQYSEARYSANQRNNRSFNTFSCQLDADLQLPGEWRLQTNVDYQNRGSQVDFGRETTLWNLTFSKSLLHKKLRLSLAVNDLLKQNVGYNRSIGANYIEETDNSVQGRFFRFSAFWYLDRFGNGR